MKCLSPIAINSEEYDIEGNGKIYLPCGKCEACRNSDAVSWRIRLKEEFYNAVNAYFVTLTYNDSKLPYTLLSGDDSPKYPVPFVCKSDVQKFLKRFRKKFEWYYKKKDIKLSYFLVSEYGPTTFRPHYHAIFFNLPVLSHIQEVQDSKITQAIYDIWSNGFVKVDVCNENRIAYCTKYMSCQTVIPDYFIKPFRLISKGIGISYLNKSERIVWHRKYLNNFYPDGSYKLRLPRYYKDKIFTDDEKDILKQLGFLRYYEDYHYKKELRKDKKALKDYFQRIERYKRNYKVKNLKGRKDI